MEMDTMEMINNQEQFKSTLKAAFVEALEERRDLLREVVEEVIEEIALARAIAAGDVTETVSRDEVFQLLSAQT